MASYSDAGLVGLTAVAPSSEIDKVTHGLHDLFQDWFTVPPDLPHQKHYFNCFHIYIILPSKKDKMKLGHHKQSLKSTNRALLQKKILKNMFLKIFIFFNFQKIMTIIK